MRFCVTHRRRSSKSFGPFFSRERHGMLRKMVPDLVLYHADCTDGFGAAWAIWKRYPSAEFIPADHGLPPPVSCAGRRVVLVDFAYPRPILEEMAEGASELQALDHPNTSKKAPKGLPYGRSDLEKSGAIRA